MKTICTLSALSLAILVTPAQALSPGDQYNMDLMLNGGPASVRKAAQNIYRSGSAQQVTDTLAEITLKNRASTDNTTIDSVAWGCKALVQSGGGRYHTVVNSLANDDSVHAKARKHCSKAAGSGSASGAQYQPGSVSLAQAKSRAAANNAPANGGSFQPISAVKEGMSLEQAYAIAGPPTSTHRHITGKQFIPFNFKGSDTHRTVGRYKGQGRIIFSNTNAYTSGKVVHSVELDPNEAGYE